MSCFFCNIYYINEVFKEPSTCNWHAEDNMHRNTCLVIFNKLGLHPVMLRGHSLLVVLGGTICNAGD